MGKSINIEYSELPNDEFHSTIKQRSSTSRRYTNTNALTILLLFACFINEHMTQSIATNSKLNPPSAYFDAHSRIYHLARDQYKLAINENFEKLKDTSYYCFREGTNWNESIVQGKCVCKSDYSLLDCGLSDQVLKTRLMRKNPSCKFEQNIVNVRRLNKPSKIVLAMPLYHCSARPCARFINEMIKQYEHVVDLFVFLEIRNSSEQLALVSENVSNNSIDELVRLYASLSISDPQAFDGLSIEDHKTPESRIKLNKVMRTVDKQREMKQDVDEKTNQTISSDQVITIKSSTHGKVFKKSNITNQQFKNVLYQVKYLNDLETDLESKKLNQLVYNVLWETLFTNVSNYRSNDKIVLMPPFTKINRNFLNFHKFYYGFGEPIVIADDFFSRHFFARKTSRMPKEVQEDLDDMSSAIMLSFQYAMSVCKFRFENFTQNYCLNVQNLVNRFEEKYWKICKVKANALQSWQVPAM